MTGRLPGDPLQIPVVVRCRVQRLQIAAVPYSKGVNGVLKAAVKSTLMRIGVAGGSVLDLLFHSLYPHAQHLLKVCRQVGHPGKQDFTVIHSRDGVLQSIAQSGGAADPLPVADADRGLLRNTADGRIIQLQPVHLPDSCHLIHTDVGGSQGVLSVSMMQRIVGKAPRILTQPYRTAGTISRGKNDHAFSLLSGRNLLFAQYTAVRRHRPLTILADFYKILLS